MPAVTRPSERDVVVTRTFEAPANHVPAAMIRFFEIAEIELHTGNALISRAGLGIDKSIQRTILNRRSRHLRAGYGASRVKT